MEEKTSDPNEHVYPIIIKRSPAQLAIQIFFILTLTIIGCIFIIIVTTLFADTVNSWVTLPLTSLTILGIVVFNIGVTILAFLKWNADHYEIHESEIIFSSGLVTKHRRSYPIEKVETINVSQNFFERIFDFGDISLLNPILPDNRRMRLLDVPHPQKYVDIIKGIQQKLLESSSRGNAHVLYNNS